MFCQSRPRSAVFGRKYDVPDCSFVCYEFLVNRGRESFNTTDFLHCSQAVLLAILQNIHLRYEGEILFEACIDWAENQCDFRKLDRGNSENIRQVLGNCLDLIEFASIKQNALID